MSMFSASMKEHLVQLYQSIQALVGEHELAWCSSSKEVLTPILDDIPSGVSLESEEYLQIVRVRLRADDMVSFAARNLDLIQSDDLEGTELVQLFWSIAFLRVYDEALVTVLQTQLRSRMGSLTVDEIIMLLWAEGMVLGKLSSLVEVEVSHVESLTIPQLSNLVFAHSLMNKGGDSISAAVAVLTQKIVGNEIPSAGLLRYACRAVVFASGAPVADLNTAILKKTPITLPAWKYSFQLSLASHGAASRGIDFNPVIEHLFPFDVMYTSSRGSKKRTRFLLEIQRPTAAVRELTTGKIIDIDGYNKLLRLYLAKSKKIYRILPISVSEWVSLDGDFERQVAYVRMRIRNALNKKRLFSGTEKDEKLGNGSDDSDQDDHKHDDDSDMSY